MGVGQEMPEDWTYRGAPVEWAPDGERFRADGVVFSRYQPVPLSGWADVEDVESSMELYARDQDQSWGSGDDW
jgi:hypothetical protein